MSHNLIILYEVFFFSNSSTSASATVSAQIDQKKSASPSATADTVKT